MTTLPSSFFKASNQRSAASTGPQGQATSSFPYDSGFLTQLMGVTVMGVNLTPRKASHAYEAAQLRPANSNPVILDTEV